MVRVFINHVDSYKGKAISKVQYKYLLVMLFQRVTVYCTVKAFSSAVVGASLEEEPEDVQPPGDNPAEPQNVYEVIGTLDDETSEKPNWISEIIPVRYLCIYAQGQISTV